MSSNQQLPIGASKGSSSHIPHPASAHREGENEVRGVESKSVGIMFKPRIMSVACIEGERSSLFTKCRQSRLKTPGAFITKRTRSQVDVFAVRYKQTHSLCCSLQDDEKIPPGREVRECIADDLRTRTRSRTLFRIRKRRQA